MEGQLRDFLEAVEAKRLGPSPVLLIGNFDRMSRQVIEKRAAMFLEPINPERRGPAFTDLRGSARPTPT